MTYSDPMTYSDKDIDHIGRSIRDRTLPKKDWTHAAHWAAALWLVDKHGAAAQDIMPGLIRAYNEATGVKNTESEGYHETITLASLKVAHHARKEGASSGLAEVLKRLLAGPYGDKGWILSYWSKDLLFSSAARRTWVAPDIKALPVY